MLMKIRNTLKELRHDFRMEQHEFAELLGIERHLYHRWEKQSGQPSLKYAMKIAKKTGKHVEDFIEYIEEEG
jgi:DNA-binding XRE family transcriptional regulator